MQLLQTIVQKLLKNLQFCLFLFLMMGCNTIKTKQLAVGLGWASNSVNTVKFRKNALTTFKDHQFISYYDDEGFLVLGKRKLYSSLWEIVKTPYKGYVKDAHNSISIAIDGKGYLHVSWSHHNTQLRYAKSKKPLSLELGLETFMTGKQEFKITYPQFYNLPNGNLLFMYRSGASGRGNMIINAFDVKNQKWTQIQQNLIDGENQRSAYWQAAIDNNGAIHVSWVWRESWDVSTNHDLCYAKSVDGGLTWQKSNGEKYTLPITAKNAEYAWKIPQESSLINQTAMTTDANGNPYIVTYWSENDIPQFQLVYLENAVWKKQNTGFRTTAFYLGGGGTKRIPISRPDIFIDNENTNRFIYMLFRDHERGNKISLAYKNFNNTSPWKIKDITKNSVGQWEPNYDISLWRNKHQLTIFKQQVAQIDGEGFAKKPASMVTLLILKKLPK